MSSRFQSFKRAIGLMPTFRRSRSDMIPNFIFAGVVGYATGNYIFKESVQEYWEEQNALQSESQPNNAQASSPESAAK